MVGFSTETGERIVEMHHHTDTVTGIALGGKNKLQVRCLVYGRVIIIGNILIFGSCCRVRWMVEWLFLTILMVEC